MLFGIPEKYLARGLLWGLGGSRDCLAAELVLPAWSWAAWKHAPWYAISHLDRPPRTVDPVDLESFGHLVWLFYNDPQGAGDDDITSSNTRGVRPITEDRLWFSRGPDPRDLTGLSQGEYEREILEASRAGDFAEDVALWRRCVHGPYDGRYDRDYVRANISDRDGESLGITDPMHVDWAAKHFTLGSEHYVFGIAAGGNSSWTWKPATDDWNVLYVMIAARLEGDPGVFTPKRWRCRPATLDRR
ncbi:hypothetical protein B0T22DRAFT_481290 [Podospora appendiculata]|uniref:Uncharacterized protein n=1 Tax=Podospora appendiculata TaxID=314037 RepID=A0AAE0XCD7_9PEZI|nr:hypothetical protein B0T22DRAFT_481290 [Podospora appendiculata]